MQFKLSLFVSNMLHCSPCTKRRKSLNHFSINILLGKCRDIIHYEEVTVQAKGGHGFTACRLFPVLQTLLVQSGWRSFPLPLVLVGCFSHTGWSFRLSFLSINFSVERNPWDNDFFGSCEYFYMKSSNLVLDKTMLQLILINWEGREASVFPVLAGLLPGIQEWPWQ